MTVYHQLTRTHKALGAKQHGIAASSSFEIQPVFLLMVTTKDIAENAEDGIGTVHRAMQGKPNISEIIGKRI